MMELNNRLLMEICSEISECPQKIEQFALAGKGNFLAYLQVFQSIQECEMQNYSISVTLADEYKSMIGPTWNHLLYMCGRFTRGLKFMHSFTMDERFRCGLMSNRYVRNIDATDFIYYELDKGIFTLIGSLPIRKITGDTNIFKAINDAECKLDLETLAVSMVPHPGEILSFKNFSASEVQLHDIWPGRFVNQIEAAHKMQTLKVL
ncbi:hypothetical protein FO519_008857 [Halicephalobus sp. NKZ332]|nr:hypothetical protein FO519_008857 [Halicephalobus sp. NKZ332]